MLLLSSACPPVSTAVVMVIISWSVVPRFGPVPVTNVASIVHTLHRGTGVVLAVPPDVLPLPMDWSVGGVDELNAEKTNMHDNDNDNDNDNEIILLT